MMMRFSLCFLAVVAILGSALGFQVAPRGSLTPSRSLGQLQQRRFSSVVTGSSSRTGATTRRGRQWVGVTMQIGEKERGSMPSYEEEKQEKEFFKTDLDYASTEEKVKDPVVLIALGWIFGMFAVGTLLILNGGV